mgnify:CR=1 FL=1
MAIGAIPAGFLVGTVLAVGQDVAGAGMIKAIMIMGGTGVAAISGLVYFIAANKLRAPKIPWSALYRNRAKVAVTALMTGGLLAALYLLPGSIPQTYELSVGHRYENDITNVVVTIGEEERSFERVESWALRNTWALSASPESISVAWTDPDGISRRAARSLGGEVPERYHNGQLRVILMPTQELNVSFRFLR